MATDRFESVSHSPPEVECLPLIVDTLARDYPDNIWMKVPLDAELTKGWRNITYRELADAVDGLTRWIVHKFGTGLLSTEVAAYIGINDMRYAVAQVSLIKAGYMALLPSPRNSQEGQSSLFATTGCKYVLHTEGVESHIELIKRAAPHLQTVQIPTFDELLREESQATTPCPSAYSNKVEARVIILHTSGSTGLPKPIYHTNGSIFTMREVRRLALSKGRQPSITALVEPDKLTFGVAPFFHMSGAAIVWASLLCRGSLCYLPPGKPPTSELIVKALNQTRPSMSITPPSLIEELVDTPGGLEALGRLQNVFFGGAPLAQRVGDRVNQVTQVVSIIGSTEAGFIPSRVPQDKADWNYFEWMPGCGISMEHNGESLYELTIKPADKRTQAIFHTFPGISQWHTKDLFEAHPNKKGLWLYIGRKDDVLVLNNGEKFHPVSFEKCLESHALVKGALVIGQTRFQTGLLIEPEWKQVKHNDPAELIEDLWPLIEQANAAAPSHGRVWKSMVAITTKDKPFKRAPKGSIIRRQTTELYREEIEALYSNERCTDGPVRLDAAAGIQTAMKYLRNVFKDKGFEIPDHASQDADIFSYGVDSLQVMALSSTLSHATGNTILPRVIYSNPTIKSLAAYLSDSRGDDSAGTTQVNREEVMEAMIKKYTSDLPSRADHDNLAPVEEHTVILTGSTGSLGSHILQELIKSPAVTHIYALNRSDDASSRQSKQFRSRGISTNFSKVTFLTADLGQESFNLDQGVYKDMLESVDILVHNAWTVDFNKTLATYEDVHIAGTRRAVEFSLQSKYNAQIVFVSSVASVGNWFASHPEDKSIPEKLPTSHSVALPQGYGESKHVASMILANAADVAGVPVTIVRAGQLAGSAISTAEWNQHEWFPSIIITSKVLNKLPKTLGNQGLIDWVPMDLAAQSIVEISLARSHSPVTLDVVHLTNPRTVSWEALIPTVREVLKHATGCDIRVVSYQEWLDALRASPRTREEIERKPGLKLLDFYAGMQTEARKPATMATTHTQDLSTTVREMPAINEDLMEKWLQEWLRYT